MAVQTVLILGGYGETGRRIAQHLLHRTKVRVRIAGRNLDEARRLADALNKKYAGKRAEALRMDANDALSVRSAMDGIGFFVQAGPAFPVETVRMLAEQTLEQNADWMDVQLDPLQARTLREYEDDIRGKNCCFATQGGFHPGLPAALVRWADLRLEKLDEAHVAGFINPEGGLIMTQGVDELIELFQDYRVKVFRDGVWQDVDLKDMNNFPKFDLALGFGRQSFTPMQLDELNALPEMIPTLKDTAFYVGGFNWFTNFVVSPMIMAGGKYLKKIPNVAWGKLLCWSTSTFGRPPYGTLLQLNAMGWRDKQRVELRLALTHPDEYELTAVPMVATMQQMMERKSHPVGVHFMAHIPEPKRLLSDMEAMGITIEKKFRPLSG